MSRALQPAKRNEKASQEMPIRADAGGLGATLGVGQLLVDQQARHWRAYLIPARGHFEVNDSTFDSRDDAANQDERIIFMSQYA
ncbi:hypothetical protein [uncultured Enterovirga sp.]|uniref:hypothetical protein n=1 Tax=uncultured Enterovirga sp. TaxID=2026352 RepID=UPI0035CBD062